MTFSYSGDPSRSSRDLVRFLIGDTSKQDQLLQDAEIDWVLTQYNAPMNASIRCCEVVVAKLSRLSDESVGGLSVSFSQKAESYRKLRRDLVRRLATEDAVPYCGGISKSDKQQVLNAGDRVPTDFNVHMLENWQLSPWVSGSWTGDYWPYYRNV